MYEDLYNFWFDSNVIKNIWFSSTPNDDKNIYNKFGQYLSSYNSDDKNINQYVIKIVLLDQITRHIDRHLNQNKLLSNMFAQEALQMSLEIIDSNYQFFEKLLPEEQIMVLMPLRHTFQQSYLEKSLMIINKLRQNDKNNSFYRRFWMANLISLEKHLQIDLFNPYIDSHPIWNFNQSLICPTSKFNPEESRDYLLQIENYKYQLKQDKIAQSFINILGKSSQTKNVIISLSGGSDSMVASYILKMIGYNLIAVMVVYNNRDTSQSELEFVKWWCSKIGIKLYYRQITEIKRTLDTDREFYESYTRNVRFRLYQYVCDLLGESVPVVLGHNLDDTLENIFTNLRKSVKIDNLLGMNYFHVENNIHIYRPMLEIWKNDIMEYARKYGIPYLYDSTPRDCWRGILRHNVVLPILNLEHGDQILKSVYKLANDMKFIISFFKRYIIENTNVIKNNNHIIINFLDDNLILNFIYWDLLFDYLSGEEYKLSKPTNNSIRSLIQRLDDIFNKKKSLKNTTYEIINLEKTFIGHIYKEHLELILI